MVKSIEHFKSSLIDLIDKVSKSPEQIVGVDCLTIACKGNWEGLEPELRPYVSTLLKSKDYVMTDFSVLHDEGWTRIRVYLISDKNVTVYIDDLERKIKLRDTPKQYLNALNKAIIMLDEYNTRFGNIKSWDKTKEITELDEILKLLK